MEIARDSDAGAGAGADKPAEGQEPQAAQPDVGAIQKENADLKQRVEQMAKDQEASKAYVQQLIANVQLAQQRMQQGNEQQDEGQSLNEAFQEDPVRAADHLFNLKMQPLHESYLNNQAMLNRQFAADRLAKDETYGKYWKKYEKEVDEFLEKIPLNIRAQPTSIENAFKFVLVNHMAELEADIKSNDVEKQKQAFVEGKSAGSPQAKQSKELSPEERRVAEGLGLSDADYIKWRDV